jgi:plasmid stabilization system protein ParE
MAYEVIFNKQFTKQVIKISKYLEKHWSEKVAEQFIARVDDKVLKISKNPTIGAPLAKGIRKIILDRHNKIYYRLIDKRVILIDLFETKQDPQKNKYE